MKRWLGLAAVLGMLWVGAPAATTQATGGGSGVTGRITEGPTCPVEQNPPAPQCAPRGLKAAMRVRGLSRGLPTEIVRSGSDGRFRAPLAPGRYRVTPLPPAGSPFPRPPAPFDVTVSAHRYRTLSVIYDTGIR